MSSKKFIDTIRTKSLDYNDKFKQLKIEMLKSIDYMEYHSYFEQDVKMFYNIVQYHMIDEVCLPDNLIVSSTEQIEHVYFMVEGAAQVEIKIAGEMHKLEVLKSRDTFG